MIFEHMRVTGTHESILDFSNSMSVALRGDDDQGFDTTWSEEQLSIQEILADPIVESLHRMRIRESEQFKTVLALYD